MTDINKLKELAVRAAGLTVHEHLNDGLWVSYGDGPRFGWNPRDDDGEAFRLAVMHDLEIHSPKTNPTVMFRTAEDDVFYQDTCIRLAILRAAAEIGKSMGGGE